MEWQLLNNIISSSKRVLLSTHVNPDGDGLGSQLGMYYYLKDLGKECRIINCSQLPKHYNFLNNDSIFEKYDSTKHSNWIKKTDLAIIFDIGDYKRLNEVSVELENNKIFIASIDHHPSVDPFFDECFVDVNMPATGYMVWQFLIYNNYRDIHINAAKGLYCALITDTGSFRYNSTTPECHEMAGHLLSLGVKPYEIYGNIYERREIPQILLLALAINNIKFYENGEFAGYIINQEMLEEANAKPSDVEGFTDFVRSIKGVEVAFMLLEQKYDIRINFRSRGKYIISDIAEYFKGGGHKLAAGATINNKTIKEIENKILYMLKRKIKKNGN